jgi:crossover junction endodeoxyribonuclease RuvC
MLEPPVRVLGIDPGLQVTGYGILELTTRGIRVVEAGIVQSSANSRAKTDMAPRLALLYTGIVEVIDQFRPTAAAVEQLYAHYEHPRTAILMGHARGVILLACGLRDVPVTSYNATSIKKRVTGSGHATKSQVQYAMLRELGLPTLPEPPDVADALAAALCHAHALKGVAAP